tara:strand:+ start:424 stop:651 length:228 start_codon:yes stop_codon:yes gene_type:complete
MSEFQKSLLVQQTIQRVASDPFSENVTHGGLHPSSLAKIVENIFWSGERNFDSVTIKVTKELDDHHISIKVLERE